MQKEELTSQLQVLKGVASAESSRYRHVCIRDVCAARCERGAVSADHESAA